MSCRHGLLEGNCSLPSRSSLVSGLCNWTIWYLWVYVRGWNKQKKESSDESRRKWSVKRERGVVGYMKESRSWWCTPVIYLPWLPHVTSTLMQPGYFRKCNLFCQIYFSHFYSAAVFAYLILYMAKLPLDGFIHVLERRGSRCCKRQSLNEKVLYLEMLAILLCSSGCVVCFHISKEHLLQLNWNACEVVAG